MNKLTIELVPKTCWYTNVRSEVSEDEWDIIRNKSYKNANYKCEICGSTGLDQGFKHKLECHEIWEYDDVNKIQKLIGLISLCPYCHKCKHPGLAQLKGEETIVENQLIKVNDISRNEAKELIHKAFELWDERSKCSWKLDISYLKTYLIN